MKKFLLISLPLLLVLPNLFCAGKQGTPAPNESASKLTQAVFPTSLKQAGEQKKFVIVDFYTDWCKWCKVLEQRTYSHSEVKKIMDRSFVLEKYNPEKAAPVSYQGRRYTGLDVVRAFNVQGFPTIMFLDQEGEIVGSISGFVPPEIFVKILIFVENGGYKEQQFNEFLKTL